MAATYGAPGVYIEERPSGSMPLQGVGTAVAAFVGFTATYNADAGDPTDPDGVKPQLVTSWPQYERIYGGFAPGILLPHSVKGFFENGGGIAYIVRIPSANGQGKAQRALPASGRQEIETLNVEAIDPAATYDVVIEPAPPADGEQSSQEFTLKVVDNGQVREEFGGVHLGRGPKSAEKTINERSKLIRVEVKSAQGLSVAERAPAPGRYAIQATAPVTNSVSPTEFEGSEVSRTGYEGLAIAEDVTMVAIPDLITVATREDGTFDTEGYLAAQAKLVDWCERSHTKMAILDSPPGLNAQQALEWRSALGKDSAFGAAYYPHLVVQNPLARPGATESEKFLTVPPSGHVAGVWARTDAARGVWKAPANEVVRGIARLAGDVTTGEQDLLNPQQVNCIRSFGANGIRIWGARTLAATDQSWRYINVRRLFNFIEETIRQGTQWVVFEPNDADLWARVKRTINAFLRNLWMQGALVGNTPDQAFYVLCDESNNPASSVDEGKLIVDVGLAPVKPAEFVIFRLSQWQGGAETSD
ncbi:phage tail sheath family protein [Kibdelosporangium phytohabitans]|uniref:Phage tail protein n=1 Tax=Kibdelosporangium phytohabitans TaxID=860235 RepID=A0A0N9I080_9PSEU|nr:phage tail sheath C-terminal domain-containing protein [Kibdelosporangium phytohabitans]ALG11452.1 phage tail protein [Kibdelosporangium phytohabitans]MBE1462792.1 phage tail sheath protein FI [Kibdelosporangium phytohabitans]